MIPFYFPLEFVDEKNKLGLFRHGTDFGNGKSDLEMFQRDEFYELYVNQKSNRNFFQYSPDHLGLLRDACWYMKMVGRLDLPDPPIPREVPSFFASLASTVQEDIVVLSAGHEYSGKIVALSVNFPSGWRPEHLLGKTFSEIHRPIPGFPLGTSSSIVKAMVTRGPYVRFVWTVTSEDALSQHPDTRKVRFSSFEDSYLRVERQSTFPLPDSEGSVFLIRVYVYPVKELSEERQSLLREALLNMSPDMVKYKGLSGLVSLLG